MKQDFVALQWVSGEIGQTAEQLQRELLGFADNLSDPTRLRHSLTLAHQMHATLRMLGIGSAEQLASELEHCVQAMLHGRIPSSEASLQLMLAATLQLPAYLRRIAQERRELPFDVHALVNELRAARGEEALAPPVIDRSIDTGELALGTGSDAEPAREEEVQLLRKARQRLQAELLGLLRGAPPQEHLRALARVFALLAQRLRPGGHHHFWQSCAGLCDAVLQGGVTFDERISGYIREIDAELRAGIALEAGFYARAPSETLYRQLLELIALSRPATPVLAEIQQRHRLIPDRPGDAPVALEDLGATGAAVGVLAADLARVLEQLETTEGDAISVGRVLREVEPELRKVASLLVGLGYRDEHEILLPQLERIDSGLLLQGAELEDRLTEITAALLEVDQRLAARALEAGASDASQAASRQHPLARALAAVCREVQNGIEQSKQAVSDYVSSETEIHLLAASPARLHELWGGLRLAGLDGAAQVVRDCETYITEVLVGSRPPPGEGEVDSFAEALSSVEYFIERLLIDRVPAELILVRARASMRNLVLGRLPEPEPVRGAGAITQAEVAEIVEPALAASVLPEAGELVLDSGFELVEAAEAAMEERVELQPADAAQAERVELAAIGSPATSEPIEPEPQRDLQPEPRIEPLPEPEVELELEGEPPDPEIVEIFVEEANEVLQTIAAQLPAWRAAPGPGAAATELRRAFHTLKGSGRMVGADVVGELAWSIENLLNRVNDRIVAIGPDVFEAIERAHALVPGLVEAFARGRRVDMAPVEQVQEAATALARGMPVRWTVAAEVVPEPEITPPVPEAIVELQAEQPETLLQVPEMVAEIAELPQMEFDAELVAIEPAAEGLEALPDLLSEPVVEPEPAIEEVAASAEEAVPAPAPAPIVEPAAEEAEPLDPEIVEIFVEEAAEVLQTIAEQFPVWRAAPASGTALTELRRAFHTLKGSGRMVGANVVGELAWSIENLLNRVIERSVSANPDVLEAVERARTLMPSLVAAFATRTHADPVPVQRLQDAATALARGLPVRWEEHEPAAVEPAAVEPAIVEPTVVVEIAMPVEPEWVSAPAEFEQPAEVPEPGAVEEAAEHALELEDWLPELEPEEIAAAEGLDLEEPIEPQTAPDEPPEFEPPLETPIQIEVGPAAVETLEEQPVDELVLGIFAEESVEHLARIHAWLSAGGDGAVSDELIRCLHTLRGGAYAAGIEALGAAVAPLEELARGAGLDGRRLDAASVQLVESLASLLAELVDEGMRPREAWLERAGVLRAEVVERLAEHMAPRPQAGAPPAEPRVGRFLEEALQALFHATTLLDDWREAPGSASAGSGLLAELRGIHQKAEQLGVGGVLALTGPLMGALAPVAERGADIADTLFDTVKQGLEACLDALDRIAAGQLPDTPAALVAELEALAAVAVPQAPAPAAAPQEEAAPALEVLRARVARDLQGAELELLDIFLEEAEELMAAIDEDIDAWRHDRRDRAPFENLQRSLHTLKGGARMAGLRYLGEQAHNFETFLINQGVHFGSFDDGFFVRVADYHEQLAQTMDIVRERPVAAEELPSEPELPPLPAVATAPEVEPIPEPIREPETEQAAQPEPEEPVAVAPEEAVEPQAEPVLPGPTAAVPEPEQMQEPELVAAAPAPVVPAAAVATAGDAELRRRVALDLAQAEVDLLGIFLEEAEELMASIDSGIDTWRHERSNRAPYDRLQRDLHTLKGGARMTGLKTLGSLAHDFETMLIGEGGNFAGLDDGFFERVADFHEQLARTMDVVKERPALEPAAAAPAPAFEAAREAVPEAPREAAPEVPSEAQRETPTHKPLEALGPLAEIPRPPAPLRPALAEGAVAVVAARPPAPATPAEAKPAAAKAKDEVVRVSAQLLEDLVNLAGETSISRGRVEEQVSELGNLFDDMQATIERLQGQVRRLDIATEAQIHFRRERAESEGSEGFDPLEMDRYSQLQQLSRSLVESASDLLDIKRTLAERTRDLETVLIQQSRINSQLQEGLMRSRMVPFSSILPRIKRVVRQVAQELDKSVEMELGNMAGELDRGILERVVAPLEHMLRNAVDHGIESREKRRAAGKPATGRILIEIARDGGDVLIAISDDGAGVNLAAVRAKALERGLMEADSPLTDHEVIQFILHSGFSTATKVTQISGRGVGMDVVGSEIRHMGGSLEIHSEQGQGSRFTIRLPFTVSVSRALLVNVGTEVYALPLNTVEGVVRMRADELARYLREGAEPFQYAGQNYEVDYLGALLHPGEPVDLSHLDETVPVVLVRGGGQSLAVEVDKLIGAREIVVKGLGPQFGTVPGLSGATVLGDGSVVLIIDVPAMLRADAARGAQMDAEARRASRGQQAARAPLVMVVDDSVTVRKVTTRFLEREGMRVMTAKDGAEAMVMLAEQVPDLMLLDIEMPHMDGFEVVSKVRLSDQLKHLPIIMITSRTGEKHRERALSLGANMYLGKPYQESVLIEHINELLKRQPSR